jgi:hypothetical protein
VAKIGLPEPGVSRRGQIFLGSQIFEKLSWKLQYLTFL